MSLFTKLSAWLSGGTAVEKAVASAIGHFAMGDEKDGITDLLTMVETESNGHPVVVAALVKIQTTLAAAGLAVAPVAPATPVAPPASVAAPAAPVPRHLPPFSRLPYNRKINPPHAGRERPRGSRGLITQPCPEAFFNFEGANVWRLQH